MFGNNDLSPTNTVVTESPVLRPSELLSPGFTQSVEQAVTVLDNGYPTELHTYSERERERVLR